MKLSDLLHKDLVFLGVNLATKDEIFNFIANALAEKDFIQDKELVFDSLTEREKLMSTGIGDGLAIPHANLSGLGNIYIAVLSLEQPIEFQAIDKNPVDIVIVVLADAKSTGQHLKVLARIARLHKTGSFMQMVRESGSAEELIEKTASLEAVM